MAERNWAQGTALRDTLKCVYCEGWWSVCYIHQESEGGSPCKSWTYILIIVVSSGICYFPYLSSQINLFSFFYVFIWNGCFNKTSPCCFFSCLGAFHSLKPLHTLVCLLWVSYQLLWHSTRLNLNLIKRSEGGIVPLGRHIAKGLTFWSVAGVHSWLCF